MFIQRFVMVITWLLALAFRHSLQVDLFMWSFMSFLFVLVLLIWECRHCVGNEVLTVTVIVEW